MAIQKNEKLRKRKEDVGKRKQLHNSVTGDEVQKGIGSKKVWKEEVVSTAGSCSVHSSYAMKRCYSHFCLSVLHFLSNMNFCSFGLRGKCLSFLSPPCLLGSSELQTLHCGILIAFCINVWWQRQMYQEAY